MIPAEEMAIIGSIKDTVTILGRKFVIQTLDADAEVMAHSAAAPFDDATKGRVLNVEKLARAISTIEGVPFSVSAEEKARGMTELQKARSLIYKWQPTVVARVHEELMKLEKKRDEAVAEFEKNGLNPTTSTGSGK